MNINRNTYESFFLLYVDNELSAEERRSVEQFVEENPDLRPELEMLQEAVLSIDSAEEFPFKDSLLKSTGGVQLLNATNYEEYFLLYSDDELSAAERSAVELFVDQNPAYKPEFDMIQQCKLESEDDIVYVNKEELYRHEQPRRIIPMMWKQMAAASILLFVLGGAAWFMFNSDGTNQAATTVAKRDQVKPAMSDTASKPKTNSAIPSNEEDLKAPLQEEIQPGNTSNVEPKNEASSTEIAKGSKPGRNNSTEKKSSPVSNKIIEQYVQQEETQQVALNDVIANPDPAKVIKDVVNSSDTKVAIDQEIDENTLRAKAGMSPAPQVVIAEQEAENNVVYVANTSVSKKNKLRGLFRTASRIVERATNPELSPKDRSGIRIANFEIDLK